jgi:hypothetical protein
MGVRVFQTSPSFLLLSFAVLTAVAAQPGSPLDRAPSADLADTAGDAPSGLALEWIPSASGRQQLRAVAFDPRSGRVAAGDERGVVLREPGRAFASIGARPGVTCLAFTAEGSLLVGTLHGLFELDAQGELIDRSPAAGEEARSIARIAVADGAIAVATLAGAYVSRDARSWRRVAGARASTGVSAVGLRRMEAHTELWVVAAGDVWTTQLHDDDAGLAADALESVAGIDAGIRASALDLRLEPEGAVLLATPDRLARRDPDGDVWRVLRPTLPPGALILRFADALGRRWLATDRGLLLAESLAGPWLRAAGRGALAPVHDVVGDAEHVWAATDAGLLEGRLVASASAAPQAADSALREARIALEFPMRHEPRVEEIFRAALAYLELRPELVRNMRRGLAARGLLPSVELRVQRGRSSDATTDYDESFVSGDLRQLNDRHAANGRDVTALLQLQWDLGTLAFDADAIDISREARAVIQLRDDVLDEIAQLYFERRRVVLQLAALGPAGEGEEASKLRLRADELAAGLDAWTGGWFGERVQPLTR